jgi:DNA-binding transcriptional ArsR family regulator
MRADPLTRTFAALAHPARRAILARLAQGEQNVDELRRPLRLSGPALSRHLKVLEQSGLITRSRRAQFRPCRFEPAPLVSADAWIAECRVAAEAQFDRLETYLRELKAKPEP